MALNLDNKDIDAISPVKNRLITTGKLVKTLKMI